MQAASLRRDGKRPRAPSLWAALRAALMEVSPAVRHAPRSSPRVFLQAAHRLAILVPTYITHTGASAEMGQW